MGSIQEDNDLVEGRTLVYHDKAVKKQCFHYHNKECTSY